jgi:hypothetical protein
MTHLGEQAIKDDYHSQYDNLANNDECWKWYGGRDGAGFPLAKIDGNLVEAQRVAYCIGADMELHEIDDEIISPVCWSPLDCVNPGHLRTETFLVGFDAWLSGVTAHMRSE